MRSIIGIKGRGLDNKGISSNQYSSKLISYIEGNRLIDARNANKTKIPVASTRLQIRYYLLFGEELETPIIEENDIIKAVQEDIPSTDSELKALIEEEREMIKKIEDFIKQLKQRHENINCKDLFDLTVKEFKRVSFTKECHNNKKTMIMPDGKRVIAKLICQELIKDKKIREIINVFLGYGDDKMYDLFTEELKKRRFYEDDARNFAKELINGYLRNTKRENLNRSDTGDRGADED